MDRNRLLFDRQKDHFLTDGTKSLAWRWTSLIGWSAFCSKTRKPFGTRSARDFKTARFEQGMEYYASLGSVADAKAHLAEWMAPEEAPLSKRLRESGHKGLIFREPYGVCLIVSRVQCARRADVRSSRGGTCCGQYGDSEALGFVHPHLGAHRAIGRARYFEPEAVAVVCGGREVLTELLGFPFDFMFFTGSTHVGKVVMHAAAEQLAPVLLELGGQCPVVVDATANIKDAAEKIVWGTMAFLRPMVCLARLCLRPRISGASVR
ncbi:MAG: aldehyde dehydrogenase family protein [Pararobbsia sp.]